jgi:hypothetical protein
MNSSVMLYEMKETDLTFLHNLWHQPLRPLVVRDDQAVVPGDIRGAGGIVERGFVLSCYGRRDSSLSRTLSNSIKLRE